MNKDPMTNPSPSQYTNAYPEDPSVQRPMDGSAIKEIVTKSGLAMRPAPKLAQPRERTTGKWAAKP
jgi:hypothetical protein